MHRISLENLLKIRFGGIDEALASAIEPLLQLPFEESSHEELLAKFVA
ncbi:hypothetical protein [Candidatus Parabeggiatoa sp. HSG14]|nr:hypothetical protein [Thiotrichales bacterium HSG14]